MTFEEIWKFSDTIPGSFMTLSGSKLYEVAMQVPAKDIGERANIVEVGVDQGRSASVLLATAQTTGAFIWLVDRWEGILVDNYYKVKKLRAMFPDVECAVLRTWSVDAAKTIDEEIDLIHIDANHYAPNPELDCLSWLPKIKSGGIAAFHDYRDGSTFPAVEEAVDKYTAGWEDLGTWDSLAIRRKP